MITSGEFFPESVEVSENEIANLAVPGGMKWLGCLEIRTDQTMPVTGHDPSGDEGGITIPESSTNIMLHINFRPEGLYDVRRSLALAASYIALHETLRNTEYIVGVTHPQAARVATRFGFRAMRPEPLSALDERYRGALTTAYERVGQTSNRAKPPLTEVGIIYLPIHEFIEKYAIPSVGHDPQALLNKLPHNAVSCEAPAPESGDPVLRAIHNVQHTMGTDAPQD